MHFPMTSRLAKLTLQLVGATVGAAVGATVGAAVGALVGGGQVIVSLLPHLPPPNFVKHILYLFFFSLFTSK